MFLPVRGQSVKFHCQESPSGPTLEKDCGRRPSTATEQRMDSPLRLRVMTRAEIPFADALRLLAELNLTGSRGQGCPRSASRRRRFYQRAGARAVLPARFKPFLTATGCSAAMRPGCSPLTISEDGVGRAVSRILSAPTLARRGRESFVLAANTRVLPRLRETGSGQLLGLLFGLAPDGVFRASALALGAVRSYRTFAPLPRPVAGTVGGLSFCGTVRRKASRPVSRVYPARTGTGYAASRPMVFGLSSPSLR